jgi:hypothetical protein
MFNEPAYTRLKVKCLNCSLHFILCTSTPERHDATSIYCPQCGHHDGQFMLWAERVSGLISNDVPGKSPLLDS